MALVRSGSWSAILLLLAVACGDADGAPAAPSVRDTPIQVADAGTEEEPEEDGGDQKSEEAQGDEIGLPCDVKQFLALHCQRCHQADAKNGTPLLTRENLLAVAKRDATVMVADRVLLRMAETEKPMPPVGKAAPVTEPELEMFTAWVDQALPIGSCDQEFEIPPAPTPPATPGTPATPATPASP